ncbi:helix-turn-helix domain-containing protein [Vreelandella rituensis]|uniref:helix-turn-helix domain-containing protein n=1 Tax=Vreelandella rituensis TaxID=2282306 RepID=UPI0039EF2482
MKRAYKERVYPTPEQAVLLAQSFGCSRFVWNNTVRHEVALPTVAETATCSPMNSTLGGCAELVTARYEAPLTTYLSRKASANLRGSSAELVASNR